MTTLIITKEKKVFDLEDVTQVKYLNNEVDITGWDFFWIVLWVFLFLPVALVLVWVFTRKRKHTCVIRLNKSNRVYKFDEVNYQLLETKDYDE